MATNLDATIISGSAPKRSDCTDVGAPVRFPEKGAETVRKADKVGCRAFVTTHKCLTAGCVVNTANALVGAPISIAVGFSGAGLLATMLIGVPLIGVGLGGCVCGLVGPRLHAVCCGSERPKEKTTKPEEVIIIQPESPSPSPEPAPTVSGWSMPFGGPFNRQEEETEFTGESTV
ncbi:MAG: hypothetical protein OXF02_06285 [Simkaniaceae bacterium]|nr:hypothetical protein [Simkaniaceae bacterium]